MSQLLNMKLFIQHPRGPTPTIQNINPSFTHNKSGTQIDISALRVVVRVIQPRLWGLTPYQSRSCTLLLSVP